MVGGPDWLKMIGCIVVKRIVVKRIVGKQWKHMCSLDFPELEADGPGTNSKRNRRLSNRTEPNRGLPEN